MITKVLHKKKSKKSFKNFYVEISKYLPGLENFTRTKIEILENEGAIKKEFYTVNDILDAVYLQVFKCYSEEINKESLRKILFLKTISKLHKIKDLESEPANAISTSSILKEELDLLQENYSVDADGDFIPEEEFDDISYHQKDFKPTHFILSEVLEDQLIGKVFKRDAAIALSEHRKDIPKIFHNLPESTNIILELHVFGYQNPSEISQIIGMNKRQINWIISTFLKEFKEQIKS